MRRRLLLVEDDQADQTWMMEQLKLRFKSITVTCAKNLSEAQRAIADQGCDIIVTCLHLADGETATNIVHVLQAYAPGVPIIALTAQPKEDESVMDVISVGVRHILFKEDLQKDYSRLVSVIVDTIRELTARDANRDVFSERLQALSQKVWDMDARGQSMEGAIEKLTSNTDKLVDALDKRGGLEDRIKVLENHHAFAIKVLYGLGGLIGTGAVAGISALFSYLMKK